MRPHLKAWSVWIRLPRPLPGPGGPAARFAAPGWISLPASGQSQQGAGLAGSARSVRPLGDQRGDVGTIRVVCGYRNDQRSGVIFPRFRNAVPSSGPAVSSSTGEASLAPGWRRCPAVAVREISRGDRHRRPRRSSPRQRRPAAPCTPAPASKEQPQPQKTTAGRRMRIYLDSKRSCTEE